MTFKMVENQITIKDRLPFEHPNFERRGDRLHWKQENKTKRHVAQCGCDGKQYG
jgi:hypothetical protein